MRTESIKRRREKTLKPMNATYRIIEDVDGEVSVRLAILPIRKGEKALWFGNACSVQDALKQYFESQQHIQLSLFDPVIN